MTLVIPVRPRGQTELMRALQDDISMEYLKELTARNNVNAVDSCGNTVLMYSLFNLPSTTELLLNAGAWASVNAINDDGNTALSLAVTRSIDSVRPEVVKMLLDAGANHTGVLEKAQSRYKFFLSCDTSDDDTLNGIKDMKSVIDMLVSAGAK